MFASFGEAKGHEQTKSLLKKIKQIKKYDEKKVKNKVRVFPPNKRFGKDQKNFKKETEMVDITSATFD